MGKCVCVSSQKYLSFLYDIYSSSFFHIIYWLLEAPGIKHSYITHVYTCVLCSKWLYTTWINFGTADVVMKSRRIVFLLFIALYISSLSYHYFKHVILNKNFCFFRWYEALQNFFFIFEVLWHLFMSKYVYHVICVGVCMGKKGMNVSSRWFNVFIEYRC